MEDYSTKLLQSGNNTDIRVIFSTPFDDDFIMDGQITAWPKDHCICC